EHHHCEQRRDPARHGNLESTERDSAGRDGLRPLAQGQSRLHGAIGQGRHIALVSHATGARTKGARRWSGGRGLEHSAPATRGASPGRVRWASTVTVIQCRGGAPHAAVRMPLVQGSTARAALRRLLGGAPLGRLLRGPLRGTALGHLLGRLLRRLLHATTLRRLLGGLLRSTLDGPLRRLLRSAPLGGLLHSLLRGLLGRPLRGLLRRLLGRLLGRLLHGLLGRLLGGLLRRLLRGTLDRLLRGATLRGSLRRLLRGATLGGLLRRTLRSARRRRLGRLRGGCRLTHLRVHPAVIPWTFHVRPPGFHGERWTSRGLSPVSSGPPSVGGRPRPRQRMRIKYTQCSPN